MTSRRFLEESDKKMFELKAEADGVYIRATQGHSIKKVNDEDIHVRLNAADANLPSRCVHGTY